jgi:ureidoacrylate peracid hydrolase
MRLEQSMHQVRIRPVIIERLMARRGRVHWFDRLDPARTALVVIDMQSTFCEPGAPAEVVAARGIVEPINRFTRALRELKVPVFWVLHGNTGSDWDLFFDHVTANPEMRRRTLESLAPGRQQPWRGLETAPQDRIVIKNRYSALSRGASALEQELREKGIDTLLIAGTKTNVCCDSTGREAMMLGFKAVLVSDCCAALSDEEHLAALETFIQQFGDVLTSEEALALLQGAFLGVGVGVVLEDNPFGSKGGLA